MKKKFAILSFIFVFSIVLLYGCGSPDPVTESSAETPTAVPTVTVTAEPTAEPTETPTSEPTETPTSEPTETPAAEDADIITLPLTEEAEQAIEVLKENSGKSSLEEENYPSFLELVTATAAQQSFPETATNAPLGYLSYDGHDVYTLGNDDAGAIVLYLHGGAYAIGISESHVNFCDQMACTLNAKVYMPLYSLVPYADYSDAYAFLETVYSDLLTSGKPIYLMGDSAGGGLALGFAEYLSGKGIALPAKMVLISPWLDVSLSDPEVPAYEEKDLSLASYGLVELGKLWAGGLDTKAPLVSPIYGNVAGLCPTLLFVGTDEIMYPDATTLYHKMQESGGDITLVYGEGLWHDFVLSNIPETDDCIDMIREFCS